MAGVKKRMNNNGMHVEKVNNLYAAKKYVFKEDTRVEGGKRFELGFYPVGPGRPTNSYSAATKEMLASARELSTDMRLDCHKAAKSGGINLVISEMSKDPVKAVGWMPYYKSVVEFELRSANARAVRQRARRIQRRMKVLYLWQQMVYDFIVNVPPHPRNVYVLFDNVGGAGKTAFSDYIGAKLPNSLAVSVSKPDNMTEVMVDMVTIKLIVFDVPRSSQKSKPKDGAEKETDWIPWGAMETYKNGRFQKNKYNVMVKVGPTPTIILSVNFPPADFTQMSLDRWRVVWIKGKHGVPDFMRLPTPCLGEGAFADTVCTLGDFRPYDPSVPRETLLKPYPGDDGVDVARSDDSFGSSDGSMMEDPMDQEEPEDEEEEEDDAQHD